MTSDLVEVQKGKVELYDVDVDAVRDIITYMYTSDISITIDNVQNVFCAASLFEMLSLCELCATYMRRELHTTNCVAVYQFGAFHHSESLQQAALEYVVEHFTVVTDDLLSVAMDDLCAVISDDRLNVKSEEVVYEMILKWVEYDMDDRRKYLTKLFALIRLPLLSPCYINDVIMSNRMMMEDSYIKSLLTMARIHNTAQSIGQTSDDLQLNDKKRLGMFNTKMLVFMGGTQEKDNRALTCYNPITKKNYYAIPLHVSFDFKYRIDHHRAVCTNTNQVYLVGGIFYEEHHFEETGCALSEVKVYDPHRMRWINCAPLNTPRCAHVALHHNGRIYVLGGKTHFPHGPALDSVEVYDTDQDVWCPLADMPKCLYHHGGVVSQDSIYIVGGQDTNNDVTTCFFRYDINIDSWTVLENRMSVARAEFGSAIIGDKIYVIGGTDGNVKLCKVECYNLSTGRWIFQPDFPEDRKSMATVTFDDVIYVCGGVRTLISRLNRAPRVVETKDLWKYDPSTGFWTREVRMVQYANVHACTVAEMNTQLLHQSEFVSNG